MKNHLFTILFAFMGLYCLGQTQPADCTVTQQIRDYYTGDAEILAVELMQLSAWADTIEIEPTFVESALEKLAAVYNAQGLPARDTVVSCLDIHIDTFIHSLHHVWVAVDSATQWALNLANGIIPTGNAEVDSLLVLYGMEVEDYHFLTLNATHNFYFRTERRLNTPALARRFLSIEGVVEASNEYTFGWGWQDIWFEYPVVDTYLIVVYQHCWGDDLCDQTRRWRFGVALDCSNMSFMGSEGYALPPTFCANAAEQRNNFPGSAKAYPLPVSGVVSVEIVIRVNTAGTLRLLTLPGRELERRQLTLRADRPNTIAFDMRLYPSGMYVLLLDTKLGSMALKIPVYHFD